MRWYEILGIVFGIINFWMQASYTFPNKGKKLGKVLAMPLILKITLVSVFAITETFSEKIFGLPVLGIIFSVIICLSAGVIGYHLSIKHLEKFKGGVTSKRFFYLMITIIFVSLFFSPHREIYTNLTISFLVGGTIFLLIGLADKKIKARDIWFAIKKLGILIIDAFKNNMRRL
jgi:hypothetical protein